MWVNLQKIHSGVQQKKPTEERKLLLTGLSAVAAAAVRASFRVHGPVAGLSNGLPEPSSVAVVEAAGVAGVDWAPAEVAVVGLGVVGVVTTQVAAGQAAVMVYFHLAKKVVAVEGSHFGFHA